MRRIRYLVAASLDGYIAGPNGEYDWIITDPEIDFSQIFNEFDTFLMGRRTFEIVTSSPQKEWLQGTEVFVFSRTLEQHNYPEVKIVARDPESVLTPLRGKSGKDIWLFGGGALFRSLAEAKLVDTVEVAIIPILLGGGIPLLPPPTGRIKLALRSQRIYKTGIVCLNYSVV